MAAKKTVTPTTKAPAKTPAPARKPCASQRHSEETKAAVLGALLAGQGVNEIERQTGIKHQTISDWKQKFTPEQLARIDQGRAERLLDLVYSLVLTYGETQIKLLEHITNPAWIRQQDASGLGILIGITSDKMGRILGALERSAPSDGDLVNITPGSPEASAGSTD